MFQLWGRIIEKIPKQKREIQQNVWFPYEYSAYCTEMNVGWDGSSAVEVLPWSPLQTMSELSTAYLYVCVVVWGWNCYQRCRPSMPPPTTWSGCPCSRRICCGAIRLSTSTPLLRPRSTTTSRWTSRHIYPPLSVSNSQELLWATLSGCRYSRI